MNPTLKNLIRPHYPAFDGYVSAGMESGKAAEKVYMNANENPYPLPGVEGFSRYPLPQPEILAEAYATAYNAKADQIAMTRGADEAISLLTKTFCEPEHDAVLISSPTFGVYSIDAQSHPANIINVPLIHDGKSFSLDVEGVIARATDERSGVKMVYICSPNNPTGDSMPRADIVRICTETRGHAVVILDETYAEFSKDGSILDAKGDALAEHPNLIILRTLSKSYALAGQRMGCFINGDADFITLARTKILETYPLPQASIDAALHVLSDDMRALAKSNIDKILNERTRLAAKLDEIDGIEHIYPSDANFLLVRMRGASDFIEFAAKDGIIIRDFSNKPDTQNCIRISIGTPEQNDRVLGLLKAFAEKND